MNTYSVNENERKRIETLIRENKFSFKWALSDSTIKDFVRTWVIWLETTDNELITQEQILRNTNCFTTDVTLAKDFKRHSKVAWGVIDTANKDQEITYDEFEVDKEEWIIIMPWEFLLWRTNELIDLPSFISATIAWRSSIARHWIIVEAAWVIENLFRWTITLEIFNMNKFPVKLYPWQRIAHFRFDHLDKLPDIWYKDKADSKYYGQISATASWIVKDKKL